jgi:hypothetical protein
MSRLDYSRLEFVTKKQGASDGSGLSASAKQALKVWCTMSRTAGLNVTLLP